MLQDDSIAEQQESESDMCQGFENQAALIFGVM